MKREKLGQSDVDVSAFCLGTMTFGNQTDESDAHTQIDLALSVGITFLDCAEMYPVNPVRKETAGRSEEIIGNWIARTGRRDEIESRRRIYDGGPQHAGLRDIRLRRVRRVVGDGRLIRRGPGVLLAGLALAHSERELLMGDATIFGTQGVADLVADHPADGRSDERTCDHAAATAKMPPDSTADDGTRDHACPLADLGSIPASASPEGERGTA